MNLRIEVVHASGYGTDKNARDTVVCDRLSTAILWENAFRVAGWKDVYISSTLLATEGPTPQPRYYSRAEREEHDVVVPTGYTAEELERDNPYNQWMYE